MNILEIILVIPAAAIPWIVAGGSALIGGGISLINSRKQKKQNEADRAFQKEMYERSRADALADSAAANKYNSPLEQMYRLKQAGLNPNLIYGGGPSNEFSAVRSASPFGGNQEAPKIDTSFVSQAANQFMNAQQVAVGVEQTKVQTDNLRKQQELMDKDLQLKTLQANKIIADTDWRVFNTGQAKELKDLVIQNAKQENALQSQRLTESAYRVQNLRASTQMMIEENMRRNEINPVKIKQMETAIVSDILKQKNIQLDSQRLTQLVENLKKDGMLKDVTEKLLQIKYGLRQLGINENDPTYVQMGARIVDESAGYIRDNIEQWIMTQSPALWEYIYGGKK